MSDDVPGIGHPLQKLSQQDCKQRLLPQVDAGVGLRGQTGIQEEGGARLKPWTVMTTMPSNPFWEDRPVLEVGLKISDTVNYWTW